MNNCRVNKKGNEGSVNMTHSTPLLLPRVLLPRILEPSPIVISVTSLDEVSQFLGETFQ